MRIRDWSSGVCSSDLQLFELRLADVAKGAGAIGAFDPAGREFELALEFAVVGEEQQSLGIIIEAPDRHQAGQALGQQVIDRLAPFGVARGGEAAGGLVKTVEAGRDGFRDRVAVDGEAVEIGRANVWTPVTKGQPVSRP